MLATGVSLTRGRSGRDAVQPPRGEQPRQAAVATHIAEGLNFFHQDADALTAFGPAPHQIRAVKLGHAHARLHAIAVGQVVETDPLRDVAPTETGLAHDGLGAVPSRLQAFDEATPGELRGPPLFCDVVLLRHLRGPQLTDRW